MGVHWIVLCHQLAVSETDKSMAFPDLKRKFVNSVHSRSLFSRDISTLTWDKLFMKNASHWCSMDSELQFHHLLLLSTLPLRFAFMRSLSSYVATNQSLLIFQAIPWKSERDKRSFLHVFGRNSLEKVKVTLVFGRGPWPRNLAIVENSPAALFPDMCNTVSTLCWGPYVTHKR